MKALTILQPWASLIACGAKKIETRSWPTKYRGPLAIHAGKVMPDEFADLACGNPLFRKTLLDAGILMSFVNMPFGSVIAIADLVDCREIYGRTCVGNEQKPIGALLRNDAHGIEVTGNEIAFGDYTPGRFAWILQNVRQIEPIRARGYQRLWHWEPPEGMEERG